MKDKHAIYTNRFTMPEGVPSSALFTAAAGAMLLLFREDSTLFVTLIFQIMLLLFVSMTVGNGIRLTHRCTNPNCCSLPKEFDSFRC